MTESIARQMVFSDYQKAPMFVHHKVDEKLELKLSYYFNEYFIQNVQNGSANTYDAKKRDIQEFLNYYHNIIPSDDVNSWTASISKGYIKYLQDIKKLKPTTINRRIATLRHVVVWMERKSFFQTNRPFDNVSDLKLSVVTWNGLSDRDVTRLKVACDKLMLVSKKNNQNPLMYGAIFYVLLHTGLREAELCAINIGQYKGKYFSYVQRKGNKVSEKVLVPQEAREHLDRYLATRVDLKDDDPLIINRYGLRLKEDNIYYCSVLIKKMANSVLDENDRIHFSPHSLRHAFLKRVADKMGIHAAQELSGNVSLKEIYRYTRPSFEETELGLENLY